VYSIFRGKIGAVDLQLQREGRLILIEKAEDIRQKIVLAHRAKGGEKRNEDRPALRAIVDGILKITA
jgi:hypothetical protein